MSPHEAQQIAASLRAEGLSAEVRLYEEARHGGQIFFVGGKTGQHALDIASSTPERVTAHWRGYCANNGTTPSTLGQLDLFGGAS